MEAKEQFKIIYKKYFDILNKYMNHSTDDVFKAVKELVIEYIEDKILSAPYADNNYAEWILDEETEYYWLEVKKHANKL